MPEIYKKRIVQLLKHSDYTPLKLAQLAKALGVSSEDYPEFKSAFEEMRRAGHVVMGERNLVSLPAMSGRKRMASGVLSRLRLLTEKLLPLLVPIPI